MSSETVETINGVDYSCYTATDQDLTLGLCAWIENNTFGYVLSDDTDLAKVAQYTDAVRVASVH